MSKEKADSRDRTLLEAKLIAKYKSEGKTKDSFSKDVAFMSKSTLHRKLDPKTELKQPLLAICATYLDESEENILKMHSNEDIAYESSPDEVRFSKYKKYILSLSTLIIIAFSALGYFVLNGKNAEFYAHYDGTGTDVDLSMLQGIESFHSALYKYEFADVYVKIEGEHVEIITEVLTTSISNPNLTYTGVLSASGLYLNGRGALSYKITALSNSEVWIGVMMLELPTTGNSKGYWLTMHSDTDNDNNGLFALGDINLHRSWEKLPKAISDKF